jgi:hypothetical protein
VNKKDAQRRRANVRRVQADRQEVQALELEERRRAELARSAKTVGTGPTRKVLAYRFTDRLIVMRWAIEGEACGAITTYFPNRPEVSATTTFITNERLDRHVEEVVERGWKHTWMTEAVRGSLWDTVQRPVRLTKEM